MVVRVSNQRRKSQLDLLHDSERDTQGQSSFFSSDDNGRFALERRNKALQLQLERFSVRGMKLHSIHEGSNVCRRRADRSGIEVVLEAIEFSGSRRQIQ